MKPPYKKPPAPPSPPHKRYYKPTMMPPINPPPPRLNIDEWLTRQADEVPDLLKMYAYAAALAKHRYEAFLVAGFTEAQAFELTKIYITL